MMKSKKGHRTIFGLGFAFGLLVEQESKRASLKLNLRWLLELEPHA